MKKLKRVFYLLCVFGISLFFLLGSSNNAEAATSAVSANALTLHQKTKIYSSNNLDYFNGCEDYRNYVSAEPAITILTHGLGSKGYYWSNQKSVNGGEKLAYNSDSLIEKMYQKLDGNMSLYYAQCNSGSSFDLYKLSRYDYETDGKETDRIDDISKHIVLIYESYIPQESNQKVYDEFHNLIDTISLQYKALAGVLPRLNLVGHSRGGLTNIVYATEHAYNVASVFSLGSPYNGSVLAGIDPVLTMLGYKDKTTNELKPGVESILDYNESVQIRDAWNAAYKSDVNMNVVAYGSMTSINYIEAMLDDLVTGGSEYAEVVKPYMDILENVVNVVKKYPNLVGGTLNFISGLAEVLNTFDINIFGSILDGQITYEEGQKILSLFNVINGTAVIMDDLFIDTNSQLGLGFKDGINFNGFKRYVKIFEVEDLTNNRCIPKQPAVVHNMETMNKTYTNDIANSLVCGVQSNTSIQLSDGKTGAVNVSGEKAFNFTANYTGKRIFTANGATIKLYLAKTNGCLENIETAQNTLEYNFVKGNTYVIVISNSASGSISYSFILQEVLKMGDNVITISKNDARIFKTSISKSGYYLFLLSSDQATMTGATKYDVGKYYKYLSSGETTVYITNNNSYDVTVNVKLAEPTNIDLEQREQTIGTDKKIVKFTNPYNYSIQYKLKISWTSSTTQYAYIYNQNNSNIASVTTGTKIKTYSFTLSANQSCYIIYSSNNNTIKSELIVNSLQLKWKIDNVYSATSTTLSRGKTYDIKLVLYVNNREVDTFDTLYVSTQSDYFTFSGDRLSIKYNALIGYDIVIVPVVATDYLLTITIGYNNEFSFSITNGDSIILNWSATVYNDSVQAIAIKIVSNGATYTLNLTSASGSKDISVYISTSTGESTISVVSIKVNGKTFSNGTKFLNQGAKIVNNLYASGSGTSSSPYLISCYRHLNNIRKNTRSYFRLTQSISMANKGTWTPITSFYGTINGNNYTISNMKLNVRTNGEDYGFVEYNYGTLLNLRFTNATITTSLSDATIVMYIGVVAGYSNNTINNCDVSNATIDVQLFKGYVGGIVGYNAGGKVYDSDVSNSTMNISGYAGGIAGKNNATVEWSYVSSTTINYYWKTDNGCVGGTVGYNTSVGVVKRCNTSAYIEWNSSSNSRSILPCLGRLIGRNEGSYSECNATGGYHINYYYWHFIGWYDQSDRCFKIDDGKVGYNG